MTQAKRADLVQACAGCGRRREIAPCPHCKLVTMPIWMSKGGSRAQERQWDVAVAHEAEWRARHAAYVAEHGQAAFDEWLHGELVFIGAVRE